MTYPELAPTISGTGITKTQVETYFENMPAAPTPTPLPDITKAKIQIVANKKFSGDTFTIGELANEADLTPVQVKTILKELDVLYGEWNALNNPIE